MDMWWLGRQAPIRRENPGTFSVQAGELRTTVGTTRIRVRGKEGQCGCECMKGWNKFEVNLGQTTKKSQVMGEEDRER